jgi:hypothetical protein
MAGSVAPRMAALVRHGCLATGLGVWRKPGGHRLQIVLKRPGFLRESGVCCNVQMSCNAWTPGAGCDYRYYNFPLGQSGQVGYVQLTGYFYQTCTFGFGCDDGLMEEIDNYGNDTAWSWSF